jgi:hypothetical protein
LPQVSVLPALARHARALLAQRARLQAQVEQLQEQLAEAPADAETVALLRECLTGARAGSKLAGELLGGARREAAGARRAAQVGALGWVQVVSTGGACGPGRR